VEEREKKRGAMHWRNARRILSHAPGGGRPQIVLFLGAWDLYVGDEMTTTTDTKSLFVSLIKKWRCDLVLDIGSRDGKQSLLFKEAVPTARVVAFEANPRNYQKMDRNPLLKDRMTILPCAVSNADGTATFHIAEADYEGAETTENNLGVSSLLVHPGVKTAGSVEVETVRLDTLLRRQEYQVFQAIALWIDVESAEYFVLEGMRAVADRVRIIHVETAKTPMRIGQRTYDEVSGLLKSLGFVEIGSSIGKEANWGDVVFVPDRLLAEVRSAKVKAIIGKTIRINDIAVFLKNHWPFLYRTLRNVFVKGI
jgi:FkbM family methyltransferase